MPERVTISMQIGSRAAPGMPEIRILWRCPICMGYHRLAVLWEHLRDAHGWDRAQYEAQQRRARQHLANGGPPNAKLTEGQVITIRRLYASGIGTAALAERFGMSQSGIAHVVRRETWAHVGDDERMPGGTACQLPN